MWPKHFRRRVMDVSFDGFIDQSVSFLLKEKIQKVLSIFRKLWQQFIFADFLRYNLHL